MATLDLTKAIQHLRSHAHASSLHKCATYVKQALAAGGLPYLSGSNGVDVGSHYERAYGFRRVNLKQNGKNFVGMVAGDICSISVKHHNLGHACMYDGYRWISDFKQANCIPYSMGTVNWARVWRWKDIPGDFNVPPDDDSFSGDFSGGGGGGPAQIVIVPNQYPTHSEYETYSGKGGNIFESPGKNKSTFKTAQVSENSNTYFSAEKINEHTRIYSSNDSCIVLDELKINLDSSTNDNWSNKGVDQAAVDKWKKQQDKEKEEAKKKAEEEKKKAEEEAKKKAEGNSDTSTNKDSKDKNSKESKDKNSKDKNSKDSKGKNSKDSKNGKAK